MRLYYSDILKFDIAEIDNGHERIILMLNEIDDCLVSGNFDSAWRQVIHLIAVERKHARFETKLLEQHNYSQVNEHSRYHAALSESLNELMDALGAEDGERAIWLHQELCELFLDDLLKADLPFKSLMHHAILNR